MIATLHHVITEVRRKHHLTKVRILDAPCGDMVWMTRFLQTRNDIMYTGMDIVPDLISVHREAFHHNPNINFIEGDIVDVSLNETYDIILCRMALQHLYFVDIVKVLSRFSRSANYLLTTTFAGASSNNDLDINKDNIGRFRRINLELPPLSLTPPLCIQRDGPPDVYEGWDHFVALWRLPVLTHANCSEPKSFVLHTTRQIIYSCTQWSDKIKE